MFEAVIGLCLQSDPAICRDVLIPGYEAETSTDCTQLLLDTPPDVGFSRYLIGDLKCQPVAEVAQFDEVSPGVFVHLGIVSDAAPANAGDVANVGFIIGADTVAVIDSGGTRMVAEQIYRAIRQHTDLPIGHIVLTHMHPDHVLGASVFVQSGAQVIGHVGLERALQDRAATYFTNFGRLIGDEAFVGTEVVLPDIAVYETLEIDLGGRILELQAWPNAHTGADLTVGDPTSGILFAGDLMFHDHVPTLDGSALGWQQVLQEMQELTYRQVVPGHGGPLLEWPDSAGSLQAYLAVLIDDARMAIERGDRLGDAVKVIGQSQSKAWRLFDQFNPRNATVAYTELEWE